MEERQSAGRNKENAAKNRTADILACEFYYIYKYR